MTHSGLLLLAIIPTSLLSGSSGCTNKPEPIIIIPMERYKLPREEFWNRVRFLPPEDSRRVLVLTEDLAKRDRGHASFKRARDQRDHNSKVDFEKLI